MFKRFGGYSTLGVDWVILPPTYGGVVDEAVRIDAARTWCFFYQARLLGHQSLLRVLPPSTWWKRHFASLDIGNLRFVEMRVLRQIIRPRVIPQID